jgi:hypothetical protein
MQDLKLLTTWKYQFPVVKILKLPDELKQSFSHTQLFIDATEVAALPKSKIIILAGNSVYLIFHR